MKSLLRPILLMLIFSLSSNNFVISQSCEIQGNGTGTITLPPEDCEYISPDEVWMIIDGLPPGTTIEMDGPLTNFICGNSLCSSSLPPGECEGIGGSLGGNFHCFEAYLEFQVTGTGDLSGFNRFISVPVSCEVHTGPRIPGDPVQTFPSQMFRLQGQLFGDPDFCTLNVTAGVDYGLPSPGSTILTDLGGGLYHVDSFFDITYQIEIEGCPGSPLDGYTGITTGTIRIETGEPYSPLTTLVAGEDQYTSPCGTFNFGENGDYPALPADFFGPGSDPFDGIIALQGEPSGGSLNPASDFIILRTLDLPVEPLIPASVPTEIVQLNLMSASPIKVTYNGGMVDSFFDVFVTLEPGYTSTGNCDITQLDDYGGQFESALAVYPQFTFVEQGGGGTNPVFSPGGWGLGPVNYVSADQNLWTLSPIPGEFDVVSDERVVLQSPSGTTIELLPLPVRDDYFFVEIDESGQVAFSDGSGWNNSTWYYYPNFNWINVWFYNHPYAPDRQKIINGMFMVEPRNPGLDSYIEIVWNYSTPDWPGWPSNSSPPLPDDVIDPVVEEQMIIRSSTLYSFSGNIINPVPVDVPFNIPDYNPEWLSVDIRGYNFILNGNFQHICWKEGDCSEQDIDYGDAPDGPYPTLFGNNGAYHIIDGSVFLGYDIDGEIDGLQDPLALGDDNDGIDDEDGVNFITWPLIPGEYAQVEVTIPASAVGALLEGWVDFNGNGSWFDLGDQIFFSTPMLTAGINLLTFYVPASAVPNSNTFARFRLSNTAGLSFDGPAQNGEVEDYAVDIGENTSIKWEQLPDRNVMGYHCHDSQGSELHIADDWICSGGAVTNFSWWGNYELPSGPIMGFRISIYDNDASGPYNKPGNLLWTIDAPIGINPGEVIETPSGLVSNSGDIIYFYQYDLTVPFAQIQDETYWFDLMAISVDPAANVMWRWQGNDNPINPDNPVQWDITGYIAQLPNNVAYVVSSTVTQTNMDFGDAPDGPYPTLLANNGARHMILPGIQLGNLLDAEQDGQPDPQALGDDLDLVYTSGGDDEDGVVFTSALTQGQVATMTVSTLSPGLFLQVWIDYNQNGSWADAGEHIFVNHQLLNFSNNLNFNIPASASIGQTYMRFRYSGAFPISYDGIAPDGEVEDYLVTIRPLSGTIMDPDPNGLFVQNEISMDWAPVHGTDPAIILAAYNDHPYPGGPGLGVSYSNDDGASWTFLQLPYPPNPFGAGNFVDMFDPTVTIDGNGDLYVAHVSTDFNWGVGPASGLFVHKSTDRGATWLPPVAIATDGPPPANPALYRFNDRCQMVADINSTSSYYNNIYIVEIKDRGWNQPLPLSDIYFSRSTDGGATWSPQVILNNNTNMGNMPVPVVAQDGTIYVCWMDYNVQTGGIGTIYLDTSTDGGTTWLTTDITVTAVNLPPLNLNGGTDVLAKGAAVVDVSPFNSQHVYITYAERVAGTSDEGDIMFISSTNGGATWSPPLRVNDDGTVNDQILPWMDVKTNGTIDIAWYDRRNDPMDNKWDVYIAMSTDGGNSFNANMQVNSTLPAVTPYTPSGDWMGEYLGLAVSDTKAYVGFTSSISDINGDVYFDQIDNPSTEIDFGDAPDPTYPTLFASNGARHMLGSGLWLGAQVDSEPDGQPDPNALGDDNANLADEDGVVFNWPLTTSNPVDVTVTTSAFGLFSGWIDFNGDGDWNDLGEQIFADYALPAGTHSLNFIVPINATLGQSFARFRISTQPALSYDGLASDGEVEDYEVNIMEDPDIKWEQYPDPNLPGLHAHNWNATGQVESLIIADDWLCQGGIVTDIHWWGNYELDAGGQEQRGSGIDHFHVSIHADDPTGLCLPLDPEITGFNIPFASIAEQNTGLINNEGCSIYLYEFILDIPFEQDSGTRYWIDISAFSVDPLNPALWRWQESRRSIMPILCGAADKQLPNPGTWSTITWANQKFSDMAFIITSVEYEPEYDFGDAPDPTYPTLLANNGARHILGTGLWLGAQLDSEPDGQPDPNALGDDNANLADEDGVVFNWPLTTSKPVDVTVTTSAFGLFNGWIDFNGDGDWNDLGEQVFTDYGLSAGTHSLNFIVPINATVGQSFARFRISTQPALSYDGLASDGEVEDYEVNIMEDPDIKWEQNPDPNLPGLHAHDWNTTGQVESIILADDWLCQGGIVTDIHWWGNYELDAASQEKRGAGISHFHISIHTNDPANCLPLDPELYGVDIPFSTLVEQNTGLVNLEGCNIYLYEFILTDPFLQDEGTRYWLDITAVSVDPLNPAVWRWQESRRSIMPILCGAADKQLPNPGTWTTIAWANQKFSDMAFIITSVEYEPEYDFGDAPDPTYPTLLASNGAVHQIDATIFLGASIDAEPNGQPSAQALGDDNDGNDDEDGITFSTFGPGGSVFINLTASANGFLNAWIDYTGNGNWSDPGEQIFTDQNIVPGLNGFVIPVPANAKIGTTYARFRYSTLPGLTYTGLAPDGEVEDYEIVIEGDVKVDLKVFLEGPFMTSSMSTDLNDVGLLPLNQPYNSDPTAIWYYGGSESVSSIPSAAITDWVVVEFRDAPSAPMANSSTIVSRQAAFVKNDGTVVSLDGISPVTVNGIFQYNLYVVIWHRNHLGILSSAPISPAGINYYSYNFTDAAGKAYLGGQNSLGGGMYGMIGGDCEPNGTVNNSDKTNVWSSQAGTAGYLMGDMNMDSVVGNQDKNNIWYPNTGAGTQVP